MTMIQRNVKAIMSSTLMLFAGVVADSAAGTIATSQFNIPPYTAGVTVNGQGASDPGWAAPWQELGGEGGRGLVVTSPTYNSTGAVQLFANQVFGTSIEREWSDIQPEIRVDAYVYVDPGAQMQGQIVTATPASGEFEARSAGSWQIEGNGQIDVYNTTNGGYVSTGFYTLPYQWNEYSLIVNTNTDTYSFLFNNQLFDSPQPLPFMNPMFYVDGINLSAVGTLTTYVDDVTVSSVPEPSAIVLIAIGTLSVGLVAARSRLAWSRNRKERSAHSAPTLELAHDTRVGAA